MVVYYIFVLLCLIGDLYAGSLPDSIPRCYRNDPSFNDCLLKATETVREQITEKDLPELGMPALEQFVVPTITFDQSTKSLQFKMTLNNLTFTGLGSYKFSKFQFDPKTLKLSLANSLGSISSTSQCIFAGKILIIPLTGEGTFLMTTLEPLQIEQTIQTRLVKINGVDHLEITDIATDFPIVKVKVRFENFSNIRPEIIEALNRIIDENSEQLAGESMGSLRDFMRSFTRIIFDSVFAKVPYDDLFPISDKF